MPLLKLETNVALSDDTRKSLLETLSKIVAQTLGKPEDYVMVAISSASIIISATSGDAAFVDLRGIGGLGEAVNRQLSHKVCTLLLESLNVAPDRVYLNFTNLDGMNWGWNGNTFG